MVRIPTVALPLFFAASCGASGGAPAAEERSGTPWFEECGAARGSAFVHRSGHDGKRYFLPESMCGGAALFDADGDGDLDAYLVDAGGVATPPLRRPGNRLFLNRGDGTFEDATMTSGAGLSDQGKAQAGMGVDAEDVLAAALDGTQRDHIPGRQLRERIRLGHSNSNPEHSGCK